MATYEPTQTFYNSFVDSLAKGVIKPATDTIKVALFTDSHTPAVTDTQYSSLTGETSNGNGYTTGGQALANTAWTNYSANDWDLDADDLIWTASGGSIVARYYVMYSDTASGNDLICYGFLDWDDTSEKTTTNGNQVQFIWHANGVFQVRAYDS